MTDSEQIYSPTVDPVIRDFKAAWLFAWGFGIGGVLGSLIRAAWWWFVAVAVLTILLGAVKLMIAVWKDSCS